MRVFDQVFLLVMLIRVWKYVTDLGGFYDVEKLREGTVTVRSVLGSDVSVTDEEIQESLWYYYYDVEKTVDYILSMDTVHFECCMKADFRRSKGRSSEESSKEVGEDCWPGFTR